VRTLIALAFMCVLTSAQAQTADLVFVGDLMLDDGPGRAVAAGRDPFARVVDWLRADYVIGNIECPISAGGTPDPNKIFVFRCAPEVVKVLRGRFDALSVANNHSGDQGRPAFMETLEHLRAAGIATFGGGRNLREAHAPLWIERGGLRIAVLGFNEFKPRAFEAGPDWSGIAWSEDSHVIGGIRAARSAGADVVIPFMHWGWEREPQPTQRQRDLARRLIDAGADVVVGNHPHVTQGAEIYRGRPVIYSLGNFVFDGFELPAAKRGWLVRLTLDREGVAAWRTQEVDIDADGLPAPARAVATPCGQRGDALLRTCTAP
jgi:poly-gamma-glutamate synthesis protein (capsule biosynthesis protein)